MNTTVNAATPSRRTWLAAAAVALCFLSLYALTEPRSHADAEDAYAFAFRAREYPARTLWHPGHLLYEPAARVLFVAVRALAPGADAFRVLVGLSQVSAALCVALVFLLFRIRLGYRGDFAFVAAGLTGVVHGFWRYAMTAEAYLPALLTAVLTLYILAAPALSRRRVALAGLCGGLTLLLHLGTAPGVLAAFPVFLVLRKKPAAAIGYALTAAALAAAAYAAAAMSPLGQTELRALALLGSRGPAGLPKLLLHALVGWGQTIGALDFLFCFPALQEWAGARFPAYMLQEEIFAGMAAGRRAAAIPLVTGAILAGVSATLAVTAWRRRREPRQPMPATALRGPLLRAMVIWWAGQALLAAVTQAANPEHWILATLPLTVALAVGVLDAGWVHAPALAGLVLPLLALHNYAGGHVINSVEGGDYHAVRGAWLVAHSRPDDVILTADASGFVRYLTYHAQGRVADLYRIDPERAPEIVRRTIVEEGGRVFATEPLFTPLPPLRHRFPERHAAVLRAGQALQPHARPVSRSAAGATFELTWPRG